MNTILKDKETIFDFQTWNASLAENTHRYKQTQPYPHIVLDNFVEEWAVKNAKSIVLYYFAEEKSTPKLRSTNYQAYPQDGTKALLVYLDKKLIAGYTFIKRIFGIHDDFVSHMLNLLSRKKNS